MVPVVLLVLVILAKFKVSGHSMIPKLKPGQQILVSSLPYLFSKPKVGDIIAFKDGKKSIIKRIKNIKKNKYLVKGDNEGDSKNYGWIDRKEIVGKLVLDSFL